MGDYKSEFTADDVTSVYNKISESENAYQIPVGGSNHLGSWGYIEKWSELMSQGLLTDAKNIFVPTGSGGTAAGIIIGNYLTGNKHHLFLMQVADTVDELRTDINKLVKSFDLPVEEAMKNCQFIPALGEGYALRYHNDHKLEDYKFYFTILTINCLAPTKSYHFLKILRLKQECSWIVYIPQKQHE